MSELLIGAGSSRVKKLVWNGRADWSALTTLDINPDHQPDVVWDLENVPLPFADDSFDECHAYEVLEHVGRQGDWRFFFAQFAEFWRILRPGGVLLGTCPDPESRWAWGDPGHTRVITAESFIFLNQAAYAQVGVTAMTDYRFVWRGDFELVHFERQGDVNAFVLRAVKPSRIA